MSLMQRAVSRRRCDAVVRWALAASALSLGNSPLQAQSASLVYRLGNDTVAVEQFTRTARALTGDMVQRSGAAVVRYHYELTLGTNGQPTAARIQRQTPAGAPAPAPSETRFLLFADSVVREVVYADSVQRRVFAARQALINFPTFIYGPTELLAQRAKMGGADSLPAVGLAGALGYTGLTALGGDSVRLRGGAYAMVLRFDAQQRLQSLDGSGTTNKAIATRGGSLDFASRAAAMSPTGTLSLRETARAAFGPGGMVLVDYGRPQVRGRSVWGGTLVPFDSVWRTGANDATHLFTTRTLTLEGLVLVPGMYTLWVQHTRTGTWLIVNGQTGQWGTQYAAARDLGRVPLTLEPTASFVETFTMQVRSDGPARGSLELSWGDRMARLPFTVSAR